MLKIVTSVENFPRSLKILMELLEYSLLIRGKKVYKISNILVNKVFGNFFRASPRNWHVKFEQLDHLIACQPHHGVMCVERPQRNRFKNLFLLLANDLNSMVGGFTHTVKGWMMIWGRVIGDTLRLGSQNPQEMTDRQQKIWDNCEKLITPRQTLTADLSDEDDEADQFSEASSLPLSQTPTLPLELANLNDFDEFEMV